MRTEAEDASVPLKVSDFGLEMQDSPNFKISRWPNSLPGILATYGFSTFQPGGIPEVAQHRAGPRQFVFNEFGSLEMRLYLN